MPTYNGTAFEVYGVGGDANYLPEWEKVQAINIRHIPGGNRDVVQLGRSSWQIAFTARASSEEDIEALEMSRTGEHTLSDFIDGTFSDVKLAEVRQVRPLPNRTGWLAELKFTRNQ